MKRRLLAIFAGMSMILAGAVVVAPAANALTTGILYKDAWYAGTSYGMGGNADCDYSGWTYYFSHWSDFGQTSSIGTYWNTPHCNTVKMWTQYGGQGVCNLPCGYVGDAFNDQIVHIQIYRRAGT